jgi:hypothetical protein
MNLDHIATPESSAAYDAAWEEDNRGVAMGKIRKTSESIERRYLYARELLEQAGMWVEDNPAHSARKEELVDLIVEFMKETKPLANLK